MKEYFSKENNIPILTLKILTHFESVYSRSNHRDKKIFLKSPKIYDDKSVTIDGSLVELFGHRSISRRKSGQDLWWKSMAREIRTRTEATGQ